MAAADKRFSARFAYASCLLQVLKSVAPQAAVLGDRLSADSTRFHCQIQNLIYSDRACQRFDVFQQHWEGHCTTLGCYFLQLLLA